MLIFWKERLVFLANTKAGSTSVAAALEPLASVSIQRPPALRHTGAAEYHRYVAPYLENAAGGGFTTVALMREPIGWMGSWFRDRQREEVAPPQSTAGLTFAGFIEAALSDTPPPFTRIGRQADFLLGPDGQAPRIDHVFRYEDIGRFLHFLEDRLGCEITLPRLNVSPPGSIALPDALQHRLRGYLAPEYRLYESLPA